ncbi:hypothetical protein [Marinobacter sp.]|uniref:hypothetical protein n=1 Tax=Marinobacter sp. TaxID=50741 RepID=UPI003A900175
MPNMQTWIIKFRPKRKPIKNLHINMPPPDGQAPVLAPENTTAIAIWMTVFSRIAWIKK